MVKYFGWIILFFLLLTHLLILVNNGVFWDDWTIYNFNEIDLIKIFTGAGNPILAYLHISLQKFNSPGLIYRLIAFIVFSLSAFFLYKILIQFTEISKKESQLLTLIFIAVPMYSTKTTMIGLPNVLCLLSFLIAFFLFIKLNDRSNIFVRILALLFFIISFIIPSFFFFFIVVPLFVVYKSQERKISVLIFRLLRYSDFMILPVLFWLVKGILFPLGGWHGSAEYNGIQLGRFLYVPLKFSVTVSETLFGIGGVIHNTVYFYFLLLFFLLVIFLMFKIDWLNSKLTIEDNERTKKILFIGMILFFFGAFPYVLVGRVPSFFGYNTRHQLLMLIGYPIVVLYGIIILVNARYRSFVFVSFFTLLIIVNISMQKQYLVGWLKQEAIIRTLNLNAEWRTFNTIEVIDRTKNYNATDSEMSFFEWTGISKLITGNEDKMFISDQLFLDGSYRIFLGEKFYDNMSLFVKGMQDRQGSKLWNIGSYQPTGDCNQITIDESDQKLNTWQSVIKLVYLYYLDHGKFEDRIPRYLKIEFTDTCSERVKNVL